MVTEDFLVHFREHPEELEVDDDEEEEEAGPASAEKAESDDDDAEEAAAPRAAITGRSLTLHAVGEQKGRDTGL